MLLSCDTQCDVPPCHHGSLTKPKVVAMKPRETPAHSMAREDTPAEAPTTSSGCWTEGDTSQLIKFLTAHRSEAGDGMNFKVSVFQAAAAHFLEPPEGVLKEGWVPGPARDSRACKNKWAAVCAPILMLMAHYSHIFRYEKSTMLFLISRLNLVSHGMMSWY